MTLLPMPADQPETAVLATTAAPRKSGRHLAILLIIGAVFSKALGFVREIAMAHIFGASIIADGFRAAITGTMLPLALLQNESVPTILIPMHRGWQEEGDAPRRFAALTVALTFVSLAIMLVIIALGPVWVHLLVGGFSPEAQAVTLQFLQIMALGMPGSVLLNVLASGEIALGRSRLTTIRASVVNISVLAGIVLILLTGWLSVLAWAFALAFNGLGVWGIITLVRDGSLNFRAIRSGDVFAAAKAFWVRLKPLMAVPVAEQSNVWIERMLASRFIVGTVASLDYARAITESAFLFISQPLGLVLLSHDAKGSQSDRIEALARPLLILALPACVTLAIFAPDVARLVYARGAFNEAAVQLTAGALQGISLGLWATTLGWIVLRFLNSAGRNGMAALILLAAFLSNIATNLVLSALPISHDNGPLLLGLGEAVRGFVLLGATSAVLGCVWQMLRLIAIAAVPALAMMLIGLTIDMELTGTATRLTAASLACGSCILVGALVFLPSFVSTCRALVVKVTNRIGGTVR